jgi:hypothetical protein
MDEVDAVDASDHGGGRGVQRTRAVHRMAS